LPGPTIAALTLGSPGTVLFVGAMLVGMAIYSALNSRFGRQPSPA